ncbi:MAG: cysteine--tRNA ligase [Candidatus Pacearchaeota archaeon]
MNLKIYNTLSRKKESFKPINKNSVGIYSCGPTVYWYQHIGNMRTYIMNDVLKRILLYGGYRVKHVMNYTDVGHLTSDADEGEDKIEKAAKKEGKNAKDIAEYYRKFFEKEAKELNIIRPDVTPKATEHIKEQIKLIKILEKKGFAYKASDGIYFDSSKIKNYGKLGRINKEEIKAGKRIAVKEKKNKTDFALWKFSDSKEKRQQEWKSPWGIGFPGWHIECSAMSMKYLGSHFDIHTGGMDHIPVHHTNEIAQSESVTGKKFVNYWIHGAMLNFKGEKISKSSGGLYTVTELEKKGFNPLDLRYLYLTTHYRKPLEFSLENLEYAKKSLGRIKNIISKLKDEKGSNKRYLKEFEKSINEDLNMPEALQVLWRLLRDEGAKRKSHTIKEMDKVLGLDLLKNDELKIPEKIKKIAEKRKIVRKEKDWKESDKLRDEINSLGYLIEDNGDSYLLKTK